MDESRIKAKKIRAADFARLVGSNRKTVSDLTRRGVLVRDANDEYAVADNLKRWQAYQDEKGGHKASLTHSASLRDQLLTEKIRKAKVEADAAEGAVMPVTEIQREVMRGFSAVRAKLLALPSQLSPVLMGLQPPDIEKIMRTKITALLKELSEMEWVTGEPSGDH